MSILAEWIQQEAKNCPSDHRAASGLPTYEAKVAIQQRLEIACDSDEISETIKTRLNLNILIVLHTVPFSYSIIDTHFAVGLQIRNMALLIYSWRWTSTIETVCARQLHVWHWRYYITKEQYKMLRIFNTINRIFPNLSTLSKILRGNSTAAPQSNILWTLLWIQDKRPDPGQHKFTTILHSKPDNTVSCIQHKMLRRTPQISRLPNLCEIHLPRCITNFKSGKLTKTKHICNTCNYTMN